MMAKFLAPISKLSFRVLNILKAGGLCSICLLFFVYIRRSMKKLAPGYTFSTSGLRSTARHFRKSVESMDIKCQKWNSAYAKLTKAANVTNTREVGPFGKLRDRFPFGGPLRQAQGPDLRVTRVWPSGKLRDRFLLLFRINPF